MAATTLPRAEESALDYPWKAPKAAGPLLVATDGLPESDGALRAAAEIARRRGVSVVLLSVHQPLPLVAPEIVPPGGFGRDVEARDALRAQVREQITRVGVGESWPLETVTGDPAAVIASMSRDVGASLIVMGLGEHGLFERLLGDETVLKVVRLSSGAVLAVGPGFSGLPHRVIAALDFSASSGHAATLGAQIASPGGTLTLAHVVSSHSDRANWSASNTAYRGSVGRALDRIVTEIGGDQSLGIERRVLAGDPARALLELAMETDADLIVTGTHGHNFFTRLLVGSVSTRLLREAHCSILIAPHEDAPGYLEEFPEERGRFAFYEWAERLEEFTRRNGGRRTVLEVIDPGFGAQIQERGERFIGASFDPWDARVHLMFENDSGQHLTRSIGDVTGVQMLRDRAGIDRLLRVAHGRGQTLLTLER